jgi:hypothetical protein
MFWIFIPVADFWGLRQELFSAFLPEIRVRRHWLGTYVLPVFWNIQQNFLDYSKLDKVGITVINNMLCQVRSFRKRSQEVLCRALPSPFQEINQAEVYLSHFFCSIWIKKRRNFHPRICNTSIVRWHWQSWEWKSVGWRKFQQKVLFTDNYCSLPMQPLVFLIRTRIYIWSSFD